MKFIVSHAIKENFRRKCYFIVCLFACFLVSLVSLVAKTVVTQGALIFLMLGEKESGEMDIILTPILSERNTTKAKPDDYFIDYAFFNYSQFNEIMQNSPANFKKTKKKKKNEITPKSVIETSTVRGDYRAIVQSKRAQLMLIDTEKEKKLEIGRAYPYKKLNKGECLAHSSLTYDLVDNKLDFSIEMSVFIRDTLLDFYYNNKSHYNENITKIGNLTTRINYTCTVKDKFKDSFGKAGDESDNLIIMELEYFYETMSEFLPENITEMFDDYGKLLKEINPKDYGNIMIVNFPPNRINAYLESDYNTLVGKGAKYANMILEQVNSLQNIDVSMPLIGKLERYNFGSVLLNLILNIIIISLFILSLILIYSLLMITMETNSFEFGILRLIGNTKKNMILIVIFQCILFAVPAFCLAFIVQFWILSLINSSIKNFIGTDLNLTFSTESLTMALIVNFLSPITAAILPIRSILKKNIAISLNSMINKTTGMKIEVVSVEKKEQNTLIVFGLITFLYGASIYYFLPLSLISSNFGMLGVIFLWILFGILLGFVILSMNLENILQKFFTYVLMFPSKSYTKTLIIKNLTAHRIKNRKTSLMYSLSVGVFIMVSVGLDIILQSAKKEELMRKGSEVHLRAYGSSPINPEDIKYSIMNMFKQGAIESFSYTTPSLEYICFGSEFNIMNLGKSLTFTTDIKSISPSYFSTTRKDGLKIGSSQNYKNKAYNKLSPSEQLFLSENKGKIGLSGIFNWEFGANIKEDVFVTAKRANKEMTFINKPAFLLNSASGLQMNSEPSMMYQRATLVSHSQYMDMWQKCTNYFSNTVEEVKGLSYEDFLIGGINLKLNKTTNPQKALDSISKIVQEDPAYTVSVWFFNSLQDRLDTISKMIYQIFYVVSTTVLFFCFFNLTASMTINIFEQKKEIAIMRSLGMKSSHVVFVFVAEAVILILTSSFIGTVIGSLISYTMSLQWQIFMNISLAFSINLGSLLFVIIFSIIGGILSTITPATRMMKTPISTLVRSV